MAAIEDQRARIAPIRSATLIAHRYELGQTLALGGMATVWRGWDRRLCRPVAVKTLRQEDLDDATAHTRLRREALVLAALSHPNIVEAHDVVEEDGWPYLIMELVEGEDLKRRIHQRGAIDPLEALGIARQMCEALHAAHLRGVIHRDVKPHNILLTRSRHAKLTDFGLALSPLDTDPEDTSVVFGTPEYMAPEQAMGERVTVSTDLYGLGVTLYEALSGEAPFRSPSAEETMKQHISTPITPLRTLRPDLAPGIEDVVMRALEKEPRRRYASARQMEDALTEAARHYSAARTTFPAPARAKWPTKAAAHDAAIDWERWADDQRDDTEVRAPANGPKLPESFWVRLMWVVFALNVMLAITLVCALVLHLAL
ncbi:MAG TPA: serine/threonine-protein kinase [Ktedonobacterales bacterium]